MQRQAAAGGGNLNEEELATEQDDFREAPWVDAAAIEGGGEIFLADFGGDRKALIFGAESRSYSSMRLARSSSEVIETNASRSSVGS